MKTWMELDIRPRALRIAHAIGGVLLVLVTAGAAASAIIGTEPFPVRLVAGAAAMFFSLLMLGFVAVRNRRPRRLVVDDRGLALANRLGRELIHIPWSDIAGVGLLTDESGKVRPQLSSTELLMPLGRQYVSIPVWLEVYPAHAGAVARHPELRAAWTVGSTGLAAEEQRWLLRVGESWAKGMVPPVEEHVTRWRPGLWRGHRSGSALFTGMGRVTGMGRAGTGEPDST